MKFQYANVDKLLGPLEYRQSALEIEQQKGESQVVSADIRNNSDTENFI